MSAEEFKYVGTLSYLDGTPALMSSNDDLLFEIIHIKSNTSYTPIKKFEKNNIYIDFVFAGDYVMKFMDLEMVRFSVTDVDGQLKTNLSTTLSLPFNYIAIAEPNQTVQIYDKNINLKESIVADKNGNVALKGDEKYFSDKLLVAISENGFPAISYFKIQKAANKGKFNSRKIKFSKVYKPIAKRGITHNIQKDIYYGLQKINFTKNKENTIWLLKTFNAKQKKGNIHKLDLSNSKIANEVSLILDELGRNVIVLKQAIKNSNKYEYQSLIVGGNGSLQIDENTFVYPYYRFKDNFVNNTRWVIPTFAGIALPEGGHNFTVTCSGIEIVPNPEYVSWHERMGKLQEQEKRLQIPMN